MKIFAIVNNYFPLGNNPGNPVAGSLSIGWYLIPDSAIVKSGKPVFIPDFADRFVALPSMVIKIGRLGKSIAPKFATRYIESVGMGANIVAPDLLAGLKKAGLPVSPAVAFDRSLLLSEFSEFNPDMRPFSGQAYTRDGVSFKWNETMMRFPIEEIISMVSRDNTIKTGDLIIVSLPTPDSGIPLHEGDRLFLSTASTEAFFTIK